MKNLVIRGLLLAILFAIYLNAFAQVPALLTKTDQKGTAKPAPDEAVISSINATLNIQLLKDGKAKRFSIPLPDGKSITVVTRGATQRKASYDVVGEVANFPNSFVLLTFTSKALNGTFSFGKEMYRIVYSGRNIYRIEKLNPDKLTEADNDAVKPKYEKVPDDNGADACPDPASQIDIMVVYTQAAEDGVGGAEGMEALIYQSVSLTNLCYENSDINQRINLVHFEKVSYTEAADSQTDLNALQATADGKMDNVHALRNTYGADIVVMLVETAESGNCGRAFIMDPVSNDHNTFAFGVVKRTCAVDNKSFPHELGHIMSARHHNDGNTTPYTYAHGYQVLSPADAAQGPWRTIMSKISGTVRIPFFSNPDLQFPIGGAATDAMGTATVEDNHRVLNNTAATIANFRCSSPGITNVWMKDTWEDTGVEPDPATAGQAMYRSPYLWVRNAQDPTSLHVHEHEDPVFGQTNWIYTKMHNGGGSTQSGNLEYYIANASVSLTWPAGWTLVGSVPVTLTGSSSRTVEFQWSGVPDPGDGSSHYCMIARWVSATDAMHIAEGSDIVANVRENNNIIWRNLNIVDMADNADTKVTMAVAGNKKKGTSKLVFEDISKFPRPNFPPTGRVIVNIDRELFAIWRKGGAKSTGLKSNGNLSFILIGNQASLDNLALPESYKGLITIRFVKSAKTPKTKFDFSAKHYMLPPSIAAPVPVLLGGVDYEIRNIK